MSVGSIMYPTDVFIMSDGMVQIYSILKEREGRIPEAHPFLLFLSRLCQSSTVFLEKV